ncbi:MAG: reverse transcriptase/maturase family protein [Candidatus Aenigmatarchaeota archaeon]
MKTYKNLHGKICDIANIRNAYRKARKGKSSRGYVKKFDLKLDNNLMILKEELESLTYEPRPMRTFVLKDPKTRVITAPHFRDRIVHHAICNVLEPIFDRTFIHDSYACRKGKGTHSAIRRLDKFKRIASCNGRRTRRAKDSNMVTGFVLKCDIKQYFASIDHVILKSLFGKKIRDQGTMCLIDKILMCYHSDAHGKGIPIGSLTSQLFANIYLDPLDYFVKHQLGAKYYVRYMDDFLIIHESKGKLIEWKKEISCFLKTIKIELHEEKSRVFPLHNGVCFLGYRIFYHHKLLKKNAFRLLEKKLSNFRATGDRNFIYCEKTRQTLESWLAYADFANTYKIRERMVETTGLTFGARPTGP